MSYITQRDLLKLLPVGRTTLAMWRKERLIPFIKTGTGRTCKTMYEYAAVRDALERMTKEAK